MSKGKRLKSKDRKDVSHYTIENKQDVIDASLFLLQRRRVSQRFLGVFYA